MLTKTMIGKKSDAHDSKESSRFSSRLKKMVYEESSYNAQNVFSNRLWIGGWDVWENNMLNMLISTQKLYFCDDAIM